MGKSERQDQAARLNSQIEGVNTNLKNPFTNYSPETSTTQMIANLDKATNNRIGDVRSMGAQDVADTTTQLTKGIQSRGGGGSAIEDAALKAKSSIGRNTGNIVKDLISNNLAGRTGIEQEGNRSKLATTQAGAQFDLSTLSALFQKLGLLGGNLQNFSGTNTWDDIFGALNAAGNAAKGAGSIIAAV